MDTTYDPNPRIANGVQLIRPEGPLTVEVMQTLDQAASLANEIRNRLYNLRDRLLGSPPERGETASTKQQAAGHFKAAHSERSTDLLDTLSAIDAISTDLNGRL